MTIWNLETIRQEVRDITGRKSVNQMATATVDRYINEYYTLIMPVDLELSEQQGVWTKDTVAGVSELMLDEYVLYLRPPFTVGGYPLMVVDDPVRFFQMYPAAGEPYTPGRPVAALYQGLYLYLAPPPDDAYEIRAWATYIFESLPPERDQWGRLIVLGTSILIYGSFGQREEAADLTPAYNYQKALVQRPALKKMQDYRGQPRF